MRCGTNELNSKFTARAEWRWIAVERITIKIKIGIKTTDGLVLAFA
jgi:hypothetical protein